MYKAVIIIYKQLNIKFLTILISSLIITFSYCNGQVKMSSGQYLKGYVVTLENDTIEGVINLFDEVSSCREVHFKKSKADAKTSIYKPYDLLAYKRKDEVYESYDDVYCLLKPCMKAQFHRVFIKLINHDVLKVFMYAANHHTTHYYAVKYIPLVQKNEFKPIPYKSKKHIKNVVSSYFSDYPELAEKLKEYKYKYEDFDQMVEDYTKWYKTN